MKLTLKEMQLAIHQTHDCEATRCLEVMEVTPDKNSPNDTIKVYLFEIEGHPAATRCFAWGVQQNQRTLLIAAVLQTGGVRNADLAVRSYRGAQVNGKQDDKSTDTAHDRCSMFPPAA